MSSAENQDEVMDFETSSEILKKPRQFGLFTILQHDKGSLYYVIGVPEHHLVKTCKPGVIGMVESWEDCYSYLMADGRICHRTKDNMESPGRFRTLSAEECQQLPAGTLDFIKTWQDKMMQQIMNSYVRFVNTVTPGILAQ